MNRKLTAVAITGIAIAMLTTGCSHTKAQTAGTIRNNGTQHSSLEGRLEMAEGATINGNVYFGTGPHDSEAAEQGGAALEADVRDAGNTGVPNIGGGQ